MDPSLPAIPSENESIAKHPSVQRVSAALQGFNHRRDIQWLKNSARTAEQAAQALGLEVGQIASSLVFTRVNLTAPQTSARDKSTTEYPALLPVLVITSGRHRVDTRLVAQELGAPELGRADADFVRTWSGFAIGGVAPVGWKSLSEHHYDLSCLTVVVDQALSDYAQVWAAAGHPHTVFPTTHDDLVRMTAGRSMKVSA